MINSSEDSIKPIPFLRWAGGKQWFVKYLSTIEGCFFNRYFEPFLGAGAVFFHLNNFKNATLSDLNEDLIETYVCIKEQLNNVVDTLSTFKNTEEAYYKIRDKYYSKDYQRAARFIYLNKTSFNGIYRVNKNGVYNVPYGFKSTAKIVDLPNLIATSKKLQCATIQSYSFEKIINQVNEGDLVFLDPPYTVAHENNGFIQYNQKLFSLEDQYKLADFIMKIKSKGAYYILTNAKHAAIKKIYSAIDPPIQLNRKSTIGGIGARRELFREYVFSNCVIIEEYDRK